MWTYVKTTQGIDNLNCLLNNMEEIPHGSGINDYWTIDIQNRKLTLSNWYSVMSEYGYHEGELPFTLVIPLWCPYSLTLQWSDTSSRQHLIRQANKLFIKEYLIDTLAHWVRESLDKE